MGKNLIIKGADFSANAIGSTIEWYNEYENLQGSLNAGANWITPKPTFIAVFDLINVIKLYSRNDNVTITIGKASVSNAGVTPATYEDLGSHEYTLSSGINLIYLVEPIVLQENTNQTIFFTNVKNFMTYNNDSGEGWPMVITTGWSADKNRVPVMFGYKTLL